MRYHRMYGYSLRGKPLVNGKLLVRGKRISAIALMSVNVLLNCKTVTGSVSSEVFYTEAFLSHLMPFDGKNPHSVIMVDNCAIHHVPMIVEMIQEVGAMVHFRHHTHLTITLLKKHSLKLSQFSGQWTKRNFYLVHLHYSHQ